MDNEYVHHQQWLQKFLGTSKQYFSMKAADKVQSPPARRTGSCTPIGTPSFRGRWPDQRNVVWNLTGRPSIHLGKR